MEDAFGEDGGEGDGVGYDSEVREGLECVVYRYHSAS